jgi:hypothetical protein
MLVLAGSAQAEAPASGTVRIYDQNEISATKGIFWGQILSGRASCVDQRKFKFVAKSATGKTTLDNGRTSKEGGLSALVRVSDLLGATGASFVVAKTDDCAKAVGSIAFARPAASRAAATGVAIVGVDGQDENGAFGGFVESSKGSCKANRKVKLLRDGTPIDRGTTTTEGSWSLHVTQTEFDPSNSFKVVVKKTSKCKGAKTTFSPIKMRPSWR